MAINQTWSNNAVELSTRDTERLNPRPSTGKLWWEPHKSFLLIIIAQPSTLTGAGSVTNRLDYRSIESLSSQYRFMSLPEYEPVIQHSGAAHTATNARISKLILAYHLVSVVYTFIKTELTIIYLVYCR